jgi:hypothetical protein
MQLTISTNYAVIGTPIVEYCSNLVQQLWLPAPSVTITNRTTNWLATFSRPTWLSGFYRAVSVGGDNRITSYVKHYFPGTANFAGCPTSAAGLVTGDLWSSNSVLMLSP